MVDSSTDYVDWANGSSPQYNFDTFINSFATVFIVLTNESMSQIYYDYYRTVGDATSTIYFLSLVIIGQKILLNLFLAILLENFDEGALKQDMHENEQKRVDEKENGFFTRTKKKIKRSCNRGFQRMQLFCRGKKEEANTLDIKENREKIIKNLAIFGKGSKGAL